jgi:serine/threonine-protein phosphatase 2B catalytic subunit
MLLAVLSVCSEEELTDACADSTEGTEAAPLPEEWRREINNKILAVRKMQRVYTMLRSVPFIILF